MNEITREFLDGLSSSLQKIPRFTTPNNQPGDDWASAVDTSTMFNLWLRLDPRLREDTRELMEGVGDLCGQVSLHASLARQFYAQVAIRCGEVERAAELYGVPADTLMSGMQAELDGVQRGAPRLRLVEEPAGGVVDDDVDAEGLLADAAAREPGSEVRTGAVASRNAAGEDSGERAKSLPLAAAGRSPGRRRALSTRLRPCLSSWRASAALAAFIAVAVAAAMASPGSKSPAESLPQSEPGALAAERSSSAIVADRCAPVPDPAGAHVTRPAAFTESSISARAPHGAAGPDTARLATPGAGTELAGSDADARVTLESSSGQLAALAPPRQAPASSQDRVGPPVAQVRPARAETPDTEITVHSPQFELAPIELPTAIVIARSSQPSIRVSIDSNTDTVRMPIPTHTVNVLPRVRSTVTVPIRDTNQQVALVFEVRQ